MVPICWNYLIYTFFQYIYFLHLPCIIEYHPTSWYFIWGVGRKTNILTQPGKNWEPDVQVCFYLLQFIPKAEEIFEEDVMYLWVHANVEANRCFLNLCTSWAQVSDRREDLVLSCMRFLLSSYVWHVNHSFYKLWGIYLGGPVYFVKCKFKVDQYNHWWILSNHTSQLDRYGIADLNTQASRSWVLTLFVINCALMVRLEIALGKMSVDGCEYHSLLVQWRNYFVFLSQSLFKWPPRCWYPLTSWCAGTCLSHNMMPSSFVRALILVMRLIQCTGMALCSLKSPLLQGYGYYLSKLWYGSESEGNILDNE